MSDKKHEAMGATDKIEEGAMEAISKSETYIRNNRNTIITIAVVVLVAIAGILAYHYLYKKPRVEKAQAAMFRAEQVFGVDSFALALNGNGADVVGFLQIIDKYGSTPSGNLAQAYAGISYYNLGEYDKAIEHLKKFKSKDTMANPSVYGLIGDCYVDMDKVEEGVKYFEKAAERADNDLLSPIYLIKAGIAYEALGNTEKAKASYQTILDKYSASDFRVEAEKYLQALEMK